ncbi:aldehyde dehydrogenase (NADP(+)) [Flavobacterium sp.]|uniref:aldehyde dehydrogenase (NADP(+)) n=1 Tax=Flavobacterium sp. TaxID=239 RepID=UPI001B50A612|nr:aldehyde dehydrogenase (NADP(+)) [Flavobacterium sp.]MBP6180863.1 aldehyde dehydrogenase (NADP(+)) [Flavobacterium sp.]
MNNLGKFYAINPANNEQLEGEFINSTESQIDAVVQKAQEAFAIYRKKEKDNIADFLDCIGDEILNLGDALLERCHLETALPLARLQGERGRTIGQLKLFASVVREGSWVDARIDTAIPDRVPLPKSDIRHQLLPLGPVVVFGASNFPLAFSVAGGDTASALAAGCPVVVKGHKAHPGTSEMVAGAILKAVAKCGMPEGTFSLIHGNSRSVGETLVKHPAIKAVGFTGSYGGGKALFEYANARPEPIPVFAEMGSTNPVFILPGALEERGEEIASGLAGSITLGVGQFCTNPGLSFVQKTDNIDQFYKQLNHKISEVPAGTMLTPDMKKAYDNGIQKTLGVQQVEEFAVGLGEKTPNSATPRIFKTSIANYFENEGLSEENFGPSSVLVEVQRKEDILKAARDLVGHLTATVFGTDKDFADYSELFDILELKVGRILVNGYPTGVEVCHSMVHGGPYPATTAPQSTSVGSNAIKRFVRPVCFQDYPDMLLPIALRRDNPLNIWRLVNGNLEK